MNIPSKRGLGMVLVMSVTYSQAQITTAENGLTATGTAPEKIVSIGGTLNNAATSIDFGNANTNSNFLFKKGTSNYFFIGNDGNIGVGNNSPAQKLDVTGMVQSTTGFKYGSTIGANLEAYGTYSRLITNTTTDGLMFWTSKIPSSIKFLIGNGARGLTLDGSSANLLFMDGSGNNLGGIGSANGTGHLTFLYSTAINSHTEGMRLTNTGNVGIGITAPTANLHVIQNSASQTGLILKSHSDAQTANTFEVQDAAGTAVLKVRGTQNGVYGQAVLSINQGNKTNTPGLVINNIGAGISAIGLGGADGGSVILSDFDFHHSPTWTYTNKHAKWRVINNALDGPSVESYSFEHLDQPATMNLMTLKGQTSQTGDMLRIKDGGGTDIFRVKATGGGYFADNVGIGVASPTAKLHTSGTVRLEGLTNDNAQTRVLVSDANGNITYRDASSLGSGGSVSGSTNYIAKYSSTTSISNSLLFDNGTNVGVGTATPNTNAKLDVNGNIFSSGKIAIGTTDMANISTYSLAVNGDAIFKKVKVMAYPWADYVFEMDYPLPTLLEVEQFIQKNKHLPGVPTAKEVEKNGLDVAETQTILLQKIEELTLYVIQLKKEIDELKRKK
jgi:hypothetical protein